MATDKLSKRNTLKNTQTKSKIDELYVHSNLYFPNAEQRIQILKSSKIFKSLNLSDVQYSLYLPKLWKVYLDNEACLKSSEKKCLNPSGFHMCVKIQGERFLIEQVICKKQKKVLEQNAFKRNYLIRGFPERFLDIKFCDKSIDASWDGSRKKLLNFMNGQFKGKKTGGFYLYGSSGVGKSYITCLFTNHLAKTNKKIAYVFLPDLLLRLLKSFSDDKSEFDTSLNEMISADVLVFDDVGAETYRDWFVNEYFLRIINNRMSSDKMTIFVSNFSLAELERHYCKPNAYKTKDASQEKAASRLIDRIYELVGNNVFHLQGKSWRREFSTHPIDESKK
ncbi:ATP-binding protein [[Mycoplasma] testudinis]|uniref:ATP-binding protein n=1 Tax=[Mycoplasma] testudinis TaxID=33924 RepID=UPI00048090D0|nr:ATP-binding protein [[Mycoplasma] testudinis]